VRGKEGERILTDEQLIVSVLQGNQQAFRLLLERYSNQIFKIVFGIVRNQKDAEDITQEAFIQIYQSLSSYKNQGFKTWMVRIATNKAIDFNRKQQRRKEDLLEVFEPSYEQFGVDIEQPKSQSPPDVQLIHNEQRQLVQRRLADVPSNYRDVIFAYYIEEKSYNEIANDQGVEVKTIETKLYRARKWMQKHWREEEFR
jgi:RNA polymerase sigma factor (sigma-70 family)